MIGVSLFMSVLYLEKVGGGAYGRELLRVWLGSAALLVGTGTDGIGIVVTLVLASWLLARTGTR